MVKSCVDSILAARPTGDDLEIIVYVNGIESGEREAFADYAAVRVLAGSTPRTLAGARNAALAGLDGDVVVFLDDDVTVNKDYFEIVRRHFAIGGPPKLVGGPNLNPPQRPTFQEASGLALASWWGAGPFAARYRLSAGPIAAGESRLILCNLAVTLNKYVFFIDDLPSGEELELVRRLRAHGFDSFFDPRMIVHHERRPTVRSFFRQIVKYGEGRGGLARLSDVGIFCALFIALILIAGLGAPAVLLSGWFALTLFAFLPYGSHPRLFPSFVLSIAVLHVAYPLGLLLGFKLKMKRLTVVVAHRGANQRESVESDPTLSMFCAITSPPNQTGHRFESDRPPFEYYRCR